MLKLVARGFNNCTRYFIKNHFGQHAANFNWQTDLWNKTILTSARNYSNAHQQNNKVQSSGDDSNDEFMSALPDVIKSLIEMQSLKSSPVVAKRFSRNCYHNIPGGKKIRGLAVVNGFKILTKSRTSDNIDVKLAYILGWCVEMAHSVLLIQDDIMDQSATRRGKPCWYTLQDVGLQAINDSLTLENSMFWLLEKHLSDHASYISIIELFHEAMLRTSLGQAADVSFTVAHKPQFETFNMRAYTSFAINKTSYYSFVLPISAALHLTETYSTRLYKQILPILEELGFAIQSLDDYLDCFGNTEKYGKSSTDIRNGKCSWMAVKALELATESQKELFKQHYGRPEIESEQKILNLYMQLKLPQVYEQFEAGMMESIRTRISKVPNENNVRDFLMNVLEYCIQQFNVFKM